MVLKSYLAAVLSAGIVALFLFSAVPANALTPPPGPYPGLNPDCDYPANAKVWLSWSSWELPITKNEGRSSFNATCFQMSSTGPFHLNPSYTWNHEELPVYVLAEWDSCWLNDNGTIGRVHHSDFNDAHAAIKNASDAPSGMGLILQNDDWSAWNFPGYWGAGYGNPAYDTHELDHTVRWVENLYLNGSYRYAPWPEFENEYDPGQHNFMEHTPAICIPLIFDETYHVRLDWLDYDYTAYQSSNPMPHYRSVLDGSGLPLTTWSGDRITADGALYVDRQQLDHFGAIYDGDPAMNLTMRGNFYAWGLMFGLRVSDLSSRIQTDLYPNVTTADSTRCLNNAAQDIFLAEQYRLSALQELRDNVSTVQAVDYLQNAWMMYEAAAYYHAAKVGYQAGDDEAAQTWEGRGYQLNCEQYDEAMPDYDALFAQATVSGAGILDWVTANWALALSVAGFVLSVLSAIIRNPWSLIASLLVTFVSLMAYGLGW